MNDKKRVQKIIKILSKEHSDAKTALKYDNPLELLVATVLSAQSTDKIVNKVTKNLFRKYKNAEDYANADISKLHEEIQSTGFYRVKAKYLKTIGQMLVENFNSEVPRTMKDLISLSGVARKTANIVLSNAFGSVEGIAVDTHVKRLSQRLELTENRSAEKIEEDLMKLVPKKQWSKLSDLFIFHGRRVCAARKPRCNECKIRMFCPSRTD
jgi:endonuclease-3